MEISFDNETDAEGYAERSRWVYHKPLLFDALGVPHGVYPTKPDAYPVVLKPTINLEGLLVGARLAHEESDIEDAPGHFWMPLLRGRHASLDLLVRRGAVRKLAVAVGEPSPWFGGFDHWEAVQPTTGDRRLAGMLCRKLGLQSGHFNAECLGGTVIEFHLRRAAEFDPILRGPHRYAVPAYAALRSWVRPRDVAATLRDLGVQEFIHTLHDGGWPEASSSGRNRYAVLYGDDLPALRAARDGLVGSLGRLAKVPGRR